MQELMMTIKLRVVLSLMLLSISIRSMASVPADSTKHNALESMVGLAERILDVFTVDRPSWSFALYPAASYSGRTGLAVGVMPMFQLRRDGIDRPTTITPSALISTKGMFEIQCDADIYMKYRQSIVTKAEFYYQPDKYYGIASRDNGKEICEYKYHSYTFTADYCKGISEMISVGMNIDLALHRFESLPDTIDLRYLDEIKQAEDWTNGIGIVFSLDSRDNTLNPRNGSYSRLWITGYSTSIGSKQSFIKSKIDIRKYWALGKESVIAAQVYADYTPSDNTPFHKMASFGGTRLGRAIPHNLKYVDHVAWLTQCEVRFPVYWRIGATGWCGAGNASKSFDAAFEDPHFMVGGGLRFKVFPEHGLNIRIDAGITSHGDRGVYLNVREAF